MYLCACALSQVLDVSWNSLGLRGARALGASLRHAGSVRELYLAWTGIGDEGASHIVAALTGNEVLQVGGVRCDV